MEESPDQRLARLCDWCVNGRRAAAELELFSWLRDPDAPPLAAVLLASWHWQRGESREALALLERQTRLRDTGDDATLRSLIALVIDSGINDLAEHLTWRLFREFGHDAAINDWIALMEPPGCRNLPVTSDSSVELVAGELLGNPQVIPTLVAAQRINKDAHTIALLRGALQRLMRDIDDERQLLNVYAALAELAMLAQDTDDARRWAHRGLKIEPYHAGLALVLSRIDDDEQLGPRASTVLAGALNVHPKYPDLRAALIRREFRDGHVDVARRRLQQWLQREPNQPVALRLEQELAA